MNKLIPFLLIAFSFAFVACGDSSSTSADDVESSSSVDSEKSVESSSSESGSSSSSLSSSSKENDKSSSSSEAEEEPIVSEEPRPWPADSLKAVFGGDYVPVLNADSSVDFHFERHNEDFPYSVITGFDEASSFDYMDSLKAVGFEATGDSNNHGPYFGKYVDHKIIIAAYGGRAVNFKFYDLSAAEFPSAFSAKNRGVELPEMKADGFYYDSTKNFLVVAGKEENFGAAFIDSLKALGFKSENDTAFEKVDVEGKYALTIGIRGLGVGNAYEMKFKYQDLSDYAYYRMPENFKVTYREQSSAYLQLNTLYRDGMNYYYTSSLKYTSPVSIETSSSMRFKFDEVSGVWLEYLDEKLRDSLSELTFMRIIVKYAGLNSYWSVFETDLEDFTDQGSVDYKVTTNVSGLECHKWTADKYSDTIEKIVCSADGNDYLLSQKSSSSTKSIGISEFEIGGVEFPVDLGSEEPVESGSEEESAESGDEDGSAESP